MITPIKPIEYTRALRQPGICQQCSRSLSQKCESNLCDRCEELNKRSYQICSKT